MTQVTKTTLRPLHERVLVGTCSGSEVALDGELPAPLLRRGT
jgi:hypothetical protein